MTQACTVSISSVMSCMHAVRFRYLKCVHEFRASWKASVGRAGMAYVSPEQANLERRTRWQSGNRFVMGVCVCVGE